MDGWIKLHKKLKEWEWYTYPNMMLFWVHLLFLANWKEKTWRGNIIKRGQFVCGVKTLGDDIKLSHQQIRNLLSKLKLTKEITINTTNKFTTITICNYETYQQTEKTEQQATQQSNNNQTTIKQQQLKKERNKEVKNINISFDLFWNLYDKKVGDKEKIKTKWIRLSDDDRQKIINYLPNYILSQPNKKFRKNPDTFFNNKSWNDEIIIEEETKEIAKQVDWG